MGHKVDKKKTSKHKQKAPYTEEFEHTQESLERRAKKYGAGKVARDVSFTQNRELSWLRFNARVLAEAKDANNPVFERFKFISIFHSNLDEWFMIRVGGLSDLCLLKKQPRDSKTNLTAKEQLTLIMREVSPLINEADSLYFEVEEALSTQGLLRYTQTNLTPVQLALCKRIYEQKLAPFISPLVVSRRHPLPKLKGGALYLVASLTDTTADESDLMGIVEVPESLSRCIELETTDDSYSYILLEDLLISVSDSLFGDKTIDNIACVRVTRNADIDPDGEGVGEEEDYRQHMKKVLKRRQRLQPVRLEVQGELDKDILQELCDALALHSKRVSIQLSPLNQNYIFGLEGRLPKQAQKNATYPPFEPQMSPYVTQDEPMRAQIEKRDILLCYPYESMEPLLRLLREASKDPNCASIKITLYRVAKQSRLCESLIQAAEAGIDVTVLMELRARFDEENNIAWAERLEYAGCTVIYGSEGYKVHSKICQIVYKDEDRASRITCLGTGNFNEKTAKLYCDFMLMTAHPEIGEDGATFFKHLSLGELGGSYTHLAVAPYGLKSLVMEGLEQEIQKAKKGQDAQVFMKMNSLTDRDVIDKIAKACQSGVRVVLIIRGICCILPDISGKTDGLAIRQIVGRFLEHARVYAFGAKADTIYLSSADMMTRNTERRVEIAYPLLDELTAARVISYINIQLADNVKSRRLTSRGEWAKLDSAWQSEKVSAQELLLKIAYASSRSTKDAESFTFTKDELYIHPAVPVEAKALADVTSYSEMPQMDAKTQGHELLPATIIEPKDTQDKLPNKKDADTVALTISPKKRCRLAFTLIGLGVKELLFGSFTKRQKR